MDASRSQDMSLYEAALGSESPPKPLKISPTTFKSMVEGLFEVLTEHEQQATLWLKLPRQKVWYSSVQAYCQTVALNDALYVLKTRKEDDEDRDDDEDNGDKETHTEPDERENSASAHRADLREDLPKATTDSSVAGSRSPSPTLAIQNPNIIHSEISGGFPSFELSLPPNSRLRREFFVLAIAPGFQALVLAHRPRSARQSHTALPEGVSTDGTSSASRITEESSTRKTPLLGFCSFNPSTIQAVLGAIAQAVQLGCEHDPQAQADLDLHIKQWNDRADGSVQETIDSTLMESFWTRQLQQQEDLWRGGATARKQADKASDLELKNEELLNSIRLKDEFFKTVGQELRTPLTTMKTALSLLSSPNIKTNQRQRYMDLLTQECDRQSALITSVLELVQLENVDDQATLQPIRLMDVIPGVVSTYQPLAQEKGIMLAYTVPEDLPAVASLAPWLRQIVINLLHNAIKFTPEGGQVWVKVKQQGDYVQIEVRDTGIGIATADIPKIFNRFYRVRPGSGEDVSGAGLGLSIVQQLLLRCGGSVSVTSRQGDGATFKVLLPIYQQEDD